MRKLWQVYPLLELAFLSCPLGALKLIHCERGSLPSSLKWPSFERWNRAINETLHARHRNTLCRLSLSLAGCIACCILSRWNAWNMQENKLFYLIQRTSVSRWVHLYLLWNLLLSVNNAWEKRAWVTLMERKREKCETFSLQWINLFKRANTMIHNFYYTWRGEKKNKRREKVINLQGNYL